jgi:hypothetical protein
MSVPPTIPSGRVKRRVTCGLHLALVYQGGTCPLRIAQRSKVSMMSDVACFCGCCFSFESGAEACPKCGEVARVGAGPVPDSAGRSRAELPVPVMDGAGPNGQTLETYSERAEAGAR